MDREIEGNLVDVLSGRIFPGRIVLQGKRIGAVNEIDNPVKGYILPGLVDAHVHVESSMLTPGEFARLAIKSGTTQCVSDPHEIANVLGADGVRFMIENSAKTDLKILFGVPSCVPATQHETSGAVINAEMVAELLDWKELGCLSEVMNFMGVILRDEEVMAKINAAQRRNMPIDGHAPGITGEHLERYIMAGITTDHECTSAEEALRKIEKGMKVIIRQGSAAKNLKSLFSIVDMFPEMVMFCTDDIHPDDLIAGHMNRIMVDAVKRGCNIFNVLRAMTLNPMVHYGLDRALLQAGDVADIIVVDSLEKMNVKETYINGRRVYDRDIETRSEPIQSGRPNLFVAKKLRTEDVCVMEEGSYIQVIKAQDGELITGREIIKARIEKSMIKSSVDQDVLKIVVLNRYKAEKPAIGFIKGFGLKDGAIAGSIAHDSHNIICVGANDIAMVEAINFIVENRGGVVVNTGNKNVGIPLPVAGIMTDENGEKIAHEYKRINQLAQKLGSNLESPFMTLSFMALLVIPELKMSDMGLFDVNSFKPISLFVKSI